MIGPRRAAVIQRHAHEGLCLVKSVECVMADKLMPRLLQQGNNLWYKHISIEKYQ